MLKNLSVSWKTAIGCFAFLLLGAGWGIAAQAQALPAGGSSFETAVAIQAGTYQGQIAPEADSYYKVAVKSGQEMNAKGGFSVADGENTYSWGNLYLYGGNQEERDNVYGSGGALGAYLSGSAQNLYIRLVNDQTDETLTYNLEIALQNRFDAGSQTDAGESFEGALPIGLGSYTGYLSGVSVMQTPFGNDFKDYYKISVQKGITYEFILTPSTGDEGQLTLFNANRETIDEKSSANAGSLVNLSLAPAANTDIFLAIGTGYKSGIFTYKLEVKSTGAQAKFYACNGTRCDAMGNFLSLEDCQRTTAKNCYQAADCGNVCGSVPERCIKDSDCPADYPTCVTGKCVSVPPGPMCTKNSDCPANNTCENGKCVEGPNPPPDTCTDECTADKTKCFDNFNYNKCGDYNKDSCPEWSSAVYCGEGNKCEGGKCVKAVGCQCSEWQGTECGSSGCSPEMMAETRTCAPAACDVETACQEDLSCEILPPLPPLPPASDTGFGWAVLLGGFAAWGWLVGLYLFLWLLLYVYLAICLQVLAKKTSTPNGWLAWIPIANIFLMISVAKKPLWWFLLLLIPLVNIVIGVILWMAIAEIRGRENWVGILIIVPVLGLGIPGYLAFSDNKNGEKTAPTPPYAPTGTAAANKPTVGYKHPCKYCGELIPPDSVACPFCEKTNPLGPFRCPKCHEPIEKEWKVCAKCNQNLRIICPFCGKVTFFGDHCEDCGKRLLVTCPNCEQEQPPIGDNCIKCGKPLKPKKA
ncbi:MAG: DUF5684 domain-containing protein [Patescibacteria group bacterium]|nr:DUF5684 domain-containing protein [Patescibacteria group bacterium]